MSKRRKESKQMMRNYKILLSEDDIQIIREALREYKYQLREFMSPGRSNAQSERWMRKRLNQTSSLLSTKFGEITTISTEVIEK